MGQALLDSMGECPSLELVALVLQCEKEAQREHCLASLLYIYLLGGGAGGGRHWRLGGKASCQWGVHDTYKNQKSNPQERGKNEH